MATPEPTGDLRLELVDGPELRTFTVPDGEERVIGRSPGSDVCLADPSISRRHARLAKRDGHWYVSDLDSRHGTFLNTIRIDANEQMPLADGDLLRFGGWTLNVTVPGGGPTVSGSPVPVGATGGPAAGGGAVTPRRHDTYATRATIFLGLGDEGSDTRNVSWQKFADRYGRIIVGFARNAGLSTDDAEDILQDVLLGFFRVANTFEYDPAKGRFRGYLKRVTLNAIRARHRRERPAGGLAEESIVEDTARADSVWNKEWMRAILQQAMDEARQQFGQTTWEAFELYGRREMPADAVAHQLGMSPESVRHAKSRVARAVREALARIRAEQG